MGWWTDIDYLMNGYIYILEWSTEIQIYDSEPMHSHDSTLDSEGVIMFQWNLGLIKINTLNLRTHIYTVTCHKSKCIKTVAFLNT